MKIPKGQLLPASFFQNDPLLCARELVGTELIWGRCSGIVVETEAYLTLGDEACHTFKRPSTRAFVERNQAGAAYIYFNYGMHWMLNVLVKGDARTGLILIRAIEPRRGLTIMQARRGTSHLHHLCSGPGKLTQALNISQRHHEINLAAGPSRGFAPRENPAMPILAASRVGISRAKGFPWRFLLAGSAFISVPVRPSQAGH